jgi:hypothetical protein
VWFDISPGGLFSLSHHMIWILATPSQDAWWLIDKSKSLLRCHVFIRIVYFAVCIEFGDRGAI